MPPETYLRTLRQRFSISLMELAEKAGVSNQHISRMELRQVPITRDQELQTARAIEEIIADRKASLTELERCFLLHKGRLLEPEEDCHEH